MNRSFELLWSGAQRRPRGPKPALSVGSTVRAAIDVVDAEGLAALTMSRVAQELGVSTMALYRYVPGKEDLIDLMIDMALGTAPSPGGLAWRAGVAQWARAELALFQQHPWLLESIMSRVSIGPNWVAWLESALQSLSGLDLAAKEKVAVVFLVDGHVRSAAQILIGATGSGEWAANFGYVVEAVSGDERYPALGAVAAAGAFDMPSEGAQNTFEFGLQRLLDGVEAFTRTRSAQRRRAVPRGRRKS